LDRIVTGVSAVTLLLWPTTMLAQGRPIALAVTRADVSTMRAVDQQVDEMRCGVLRLRDSVRDSLMPDRTHQRLVSTSAAFGSRAAISRGKPLPTAPCRFSE